ncbi:hypothetical protein E2C01_078245 [Portunus trituberculatus]|uniref:Uncharacterized protein n=1 Tax=Portunus trituberculatus TaxID=210409 RepID=A0A5B7IM49_PORTR|nr:hypothetical protein [Portunus trituberculatus]
MEVRQIEGTLEIEYELRSRTRSAIRIEVKVPELAPQTSAVRQELRAIRDRVTALLDALAVCPETAPKATPDSAGVNSSNSCNTAGTASPAPPVKPLTISSKEFDPLQSAELQVRQCYSLLQVCW